MMRVLIIDDYPILRLGIKTALESANIEVQEADSGEQGLQLLRGTHPDLVILKIDLPDVSGIDLITEINQEFPDVKIVVLSQHSDEGLLKMAFNAGANSYLLSDTEPEILLYAIKMSYQGQCWIDPRLSRSILDIKEEDNSLRKGKKFGESLTQIEMKVLKLMAFGFSNEQIADNLHVSSGSIRGYTNSLNLKLGAQNRAHAVFRAICLGYINYKSLFTEIPGGENLEAI
ncbi:two-component response regulator (plasmid) [Nostoc sp. HK-01]|nr:two-component response regulator [Nostoc sp. HK-01]